MADGLTWTDWRAEPIAGDASARRYDRLTDATGHSVIRMDSGPVPVDPFIRIAAVLRALGLCAPEILHSDPPVLILSDLGRTDVATALDQGADPVTLYRAAIDVLVRLHRADPPDLARMTPQVGGAMVAEVLRHYAPDADADVIAAAVTDHLARLAPGPLRLSLRDFHVENLIWRPDRTGLDRVGLLDFQDAFLAPAGYDLASLLRDVRRDVPEDIVTAMSRHFATESGLPVAQLTAQRAILGAQRNLRILGVFARLIRVDGKPKYTRFMDRTWRMLCADLAEPALADLRAAVLRTLPPPDKAGFT